MTRRRWLLPLLTLALTFGLSVRAQPAPVQATPEYGPAKGTLVIIGGAMRDNFGVSQKFIQLAGGPGKKFVIVPSNGGNRTADGTPREYNAEAVLAPLERAWADQRRDVADLGSECGRHGGVCRATAGRRCRVVRRRASMERRGLLYEHPDAEG